MNDMVSRGGCLRARQRGREGTQNNGFIPVKEARSIEPTTIPKRKSQP